METLRWKNPENSTRCFETNEMRILRWITGKEYNYKLKSDDIR